MKKTITIFYFSLSSFVIASTVPTQQPPAYNSKSSGPTTISTQTNRTVKNERPPYVDPRNI